MSASVFDRVPTTALVLSKMVTELFDSAMSVGASLIELAVTTVLVLALLLVVPSLAVRLKVVCTVLPGTTWLLVGVKTSACSRVCNPPGVVEVRV